MDSKNFTYIIATRASELALWQAKATQSILLKIDIDTSLLALSTTGDKFQNISLANLNLATELNNSHLLTGKGLFIKEIQEAVLNGDAHLAVHSMKDLPLEQTNGLSIAACLPRASACDTLILSPALLNSLSINFELRYDFKKFRSDLLHNELFNKEAIGTTSLRRQSLLKNLFSQSLNLQNLRGNITTRLAKLHNNDFIAIVLAQAGLERLGLLNTEYMFPLPIDLFIPAAAQGIIALECATDNYKLLRILAQLNCMQTAMQAGVERLILYFLGGSCHSAIGVHFNPPNIWIMHEKKLGVANFCIELHKSDLDELERLFIAADRIYAKFFFSLLESKIGFKIMNFIPR